MEEAGTIMKGIGYRYNNDDGEACVEYHVDNLPEEIYTQEIPPNLPYGGKLSFWKKILRSHSFSLGKMNASSTNTAFTVNAGMGHEARWQSSQKMKVMA